MEKRFAGRARGIALLIVLVVLVLIATLATEIAISARTHHQLAQHSMDDLLLRSAVDARIPILKAALRYDGTSSAGYDGEADAWSWHADQVDEKHRLSSWGERSSTAAQPVSGEQAQNVAAFDNTDVKVHAWCEDERSKINLRGLMKPEESEVFKNTRETLIRLIDLYREHWSSLDVSEGEAKDMVDDLVKHLQAEADTETNPMPAVKANRGRLQSVDDLLRVPGGRWTAERLFDVRDPDVSEDGSTSSSTDESSSGGGSDSNWEPPHGTPGLFHYLTVYAEDAADPPMRINVNTAPAIVLKALFDAGDETLADKIVERRRQGADDKESATGTGTGTSGGSTDTQNQGFYKSKAELTKVEGMEQDLAKYPRLNFFADIASSVYSLHVVATIGKQGAGSDESAASSEDPNQPKSPDADYQYVVVVQRTTAGFVTLYAERRHDALFLTDN